MAKKPEKELISGIGTRIRVQRDVLKLSRKAVSDDVGVAVSTIQAWENEEREPSATDILKLSNCLNVSSEWLVTGASEDDSYSPIDGLRKEHSDRCEGFHLRLQTIVKKFKSVNAFAVAAGISPSGLNRLLDGGYPTLPILIALAKAGEVTVEWLSTGGENQESNVPAVQASTSFAVDVQGNEIDLSEFVFVPRYNVSASAGYGAWNDDETPMFTVSFRRYWVVNYLKADPSKLSVIGVYGDSMEGVLNDKDIILVNHAERDPREGIYVLRIDGQLIVKRVQRLPGSQLRVSSTNTAYEPFTINLNEVPNDFEVVGKVVWFGRVI